MSYDLRSLPVTNPVVVARLAMLPPQVSDGTVVPAVVAPILNLGRSFDLRATSVRNPIIVARLATLPPQS